MKKLFSNFIFLAAIAFACTLHAQEAPSIDWQKCLGGSDYEYAGSIQQIADGGFIIAGHSGPIGGDVTTNHGLFDCWILKTDASGNIIWQRSYGGSDYDQANSIQQTTDGGFIVAGSAASNDGDVSGNHGSWDYWVFKLDENGNLIWEKTLGGSSWDDAKSVQQTMDGGFIVTGYTSSVDDDVVGSHGGGDCWVVKLDSSGSILWQKCLGGGNGDWARSIEQTTDGGFIIAATTESEDGDVSENHGFDDYWIVKLDLTGNIIWEKTLGGSSWDGANSIQQTMDGGFIVCGTSQSHDGDVTGNHGGTDYWVIKLDPVGIIIWQKSLGGTAEDLALSIQQTFDGGFIVAGHSLSNNGNVSGNHGFTDYWMVKLDTIGNILWQKTLGGSDHEFDPSVEQTTDGEIIIVGTAGSFDGDVVCNLGGYDIWLVKLTSDTLTGIASLLNNIISLYPNPVLTQLNINSEIPTNEATIRVFDLQGRVISLPTTFTNTQAQLNTTTLPDGFYTLQITNNKTGESEVGKFVKQQ